MMYILRNMPVEGEQSYRSLHDEAAVWYPRLGHCNSRAARQEAKSTATNVKYSFVLASHEYRVSLMSRSKEKPHPVSDRPRSSRSPDLVHIDVWGKHAVETYSGWCKYLATFTDDMTRMRWVVPMTTKDRAAEALRSIVKEVADPESVCIGRGRTDGGGKFEGRSAQLATLLGIKIETNHRECLRGTR